MEKFLNFLKTIGVVLFSSLVLLSSALLFFSAVNMVQAFI